MKRTVSNSIVAQLRAPRGLSRSGKVLAILFSLAIETKAAPTQTIARWKLSEIPIVTIGSQGNPQTEFQVVRGVARTSTGEIVVANGGSSELRVFDASGNHLKTFGRVGAGPGEFEALSWIGRSGDSVYLYDYALMRVSVFSVRDGIHGSALAAKAPRRQFLPLLRLSSGRYLVKQLKTPSMRRADGTFRDSTMLGIVQPSLQVPVHWFGPFPAMTHLALNPANEESARSVGIYRLGPRTFWAVVGDSIWIGDSSGDELILVDERGRTVRSIVLGWHAQEFDREALQRQAARELTLLRSSRDSTAVAARYERKYLARFQPVFENLLSTVDGNLWVERFRTEPATAAIALVVSPTGRRIAELRVPPRFRVSEVGDDYVAGVHTAEDGAQSVRLYRLLK